MSVERNVYQTSQGGKVFVPLEDKAVNHVVCSLDGAQVLTVNDGWREAMVGTISLVDCDGECRHTCFGAAPEHGKATFLKRFERELERVKSQYPRARYLGIADGAKDNGSFLKRHTTRQLLDFFHVTEYLARVAWAAYPRRSPSRAEVKTGQPERQQWLHDRCHQLKHEPDAARDILTEMRAFKRKRELSEPACCRQVGAWGGVIGDSLLRKPLAADEVLRACTGQSSDRFGGDRSGL